jgi:uncharacterized phiE125 gp8 family phage protein
MPLAVVTRPAVEPVTVAAAKSHARIATAADDVMVDTLIRTARAQIEAMLGLALINQVWRLLRPWPDNGEILLPLRPAQSVTEVRAVGAAAALPTTAWSLLIEEDGQGCVRIDPSVTAASSVTVTLTAGYGPTADLVPASLRHAILLLTAHWYDNRDLAKGGVSRLPEEIASLVAPFRRVRL